MTELDVLEKLKGKSLEHIEWYFYKDEELQEAKDDRDTFKIPMKYKIIGRCTLLGDIVVYYQNAIGVISHEEPEKGPLKMVKDIVAFNGFVELLSEIPDFSEERDIKKLKKIKKQIKSIRKQAPKNLKDDFDEVLYDIDDLIEDIKDGYID